MRVIGAGFGRTGTLSLKMALERLGFGPCHHMTEVIERPGQVRGWLALAEGRPVSWEDLLGGYDSCVDWPSAAYWRELAEYFPEAKVVLTVRDPGRWLASMNATVFERFRRGGGFSGRAMRGLSSVLGTDLAAFSQMVRLTVQERVFGGCWEDPERVLRVFRAHVDDVVAAIPPGRLLRFEVGQGWEPLCGFLGVAVPEGPFPRVNDSADFDRNARAALGAMLLRRSG
ncbi:sulfotransferase family protein [Streptosporangium sp. NBC_01495]|uniref:sulfotransferase family protein n=1 Tax=Streptosporangium sp. NBC_01495 TaxID=2903899 RepID=UPI002E351CD1|nr:sulfotransferase family protein [Streptosporangium sp. NBC_01495]